MTTIADSEARLSWVLSGVAGVIGAAAFTVTGGYYVTFMTGNAERGVVGYFVHKPAMATGAILLTLMFIAGVVVGSLGRRHLWVNRAHGATLITTIALVVASFVDTVVCDRDAPRFSSAP